MEEKVIGFTLYPDLIREVLKALSEGRIPNADYPELVIRHHYLVLFRAGYILTNISDYAMYPDIYIMNDEPRGESIETLFTPLNGDYRFYPSFQGDEFLKNLLDDTVWNETKKIMGRAGSTSLQLLVQTGAQVVAAKLGGMI